MKNCKKGFATVILLIIIVLVVVAGGAYYFSQQYKNTSATSEIASDSSQKYDGDFLSITSPTHGDILESGKSFTVVFTPVKGAANYEITITAPAYFDKTKGLLKDGPPDVLLKEVTKKTSHTITVPNSQAFYVNESSYNGENLVVRAIDKNGNLLNAVSEVTIHDKKVQNSKPAVDSRQIKILPLPTQPQLLDTDTYVLDRGGGTITLKFGALPTPLKTRKVTLDCYGPKVHIDSIMCPEGSFTAGQAAFTKKLVFDANPFKDRDTAFAIRVQYYDMAGNEPNPQGLNDESWLSLKIKK